MAAKTKSSKKGKAQKAETTKATSGVATMKAKESKEANERKLSAIDVAAEVLAASKEPMNTKQMIEAMVAKGLWTRLRGKTPWATLYWAIFRKIATRERKPGS